MVSNVRIGYACTPISIPYRTSRSFILKNFNEEIFKKCVMDNLADLMDILKWNVQNNIFLFRISSDIIPFGSHLVNNIEWWEIFKEELLQIGTYVKENKIRISMHPGQYTVLNSPKEEVVQNSIADIEYHCKFLDALDVSYTNKIILHIGGVYDNKNTAKMRFVDNFKRLSPSAKKRLVIENDDKSYTIEDILEICDILKIPAIFDNLHHKLNPCDLLWTDIISYVKDTWKEEDGRIKLHYSDQDMIKKGGAHSKSVITRNFLEYMESLKGVNGDIMLEVKDKEISATKCICILDEALSISKRTDQWAKYKYSIMEKNYLYYKKCSSLINSKIPISEVYMYIDECLSMPFHEGNFINAAQHVYGYVKEFVTEREKEKFNTLLQLPIEKGDKIKSLLKKLCKKYDVTYMNTSYYFVL